MLSDPDFRIGDFNSKLFLTGELSQLNCFYCSPFEIYGDSTFLTSSYCDNDCDELDFKSVGQILRNCDSDCLTLLEAYFNCCCSTMVDDACFNSVFSEQTKLVREFESSLDKGSSSSLCVLSADSSSARSSMISSYSMVG